MKKNQWRRIISIVLLAALVLCSLLLGGCSGTNSSPAPQETERIVVPDVPKMKTKPARTPSPTKKPVVTEVPAPVSSPSEEDIEEYGGMITYPQKKSYLDDYETQYVKSRKGHSLYVYWQSSLDDNVKRSMYVYEADPVIVIAREKNASCILFVDVDGTKRAGWVPSKYLVDVYEGENPNTSNEPVDGPSDADIEEYGGMITYPKKKSYLDDYETKYVKSRQGHSLYVYWQSSLDDNVKRSMYVYERDAVTVVAREDNASCILFIDNDGVKRAGWVPTKYLVDVYE